MAIPSSWCAYRVVSFPYRAPARVEGTFRFALEGRLPAPIESYVAEPVTDIIAAGAQGSRLTACACPVERLELLLEAFRAAGVEPRIVQPSAVCLARYLATRGAGDGGRGGWLIRLDGADCEVVLATEGQVRACYVVSLVDLDLSDPASIESASERVGLVARAHQIGDGGAGPEEITLLAPAGLSAALAESLQRHLVAQVRQPGADAMESKWLVAYQAAAQVARRKGSVVNLRRGELAYQSFPGKMQRRAALALALALATVCMMGLYTVRGLAEAHRQIAQALVRQRAVAQEVCGAPSSVYALEAAVADARKEAQAVERAGVVSCIERWRDLMLRVPPALGVNFELLDIDQTRIRIKAVAPDSKRAEEFERRLRGSPVFVPSATSKMSRLSTGGISIETELRYR
ncbi:MAG: hypothetical protein J7M08_01320 [Planctomycetes bacterium]|nr:hypothetical protein [Planctomycetota bacterium]